MVDIGRKYFTGDWLREHVKELAYLKMNYLHLHLSDNQGFRLECTTHPEYMSAQHYSKQEFTDLIALAAKYHIKIVPEIDMPGHMNAILAKHPDLQLDSSRQPRPLLPDLSKPGAYTLISDLINEFLPLFPGRYWHIGADEYVGLRRPPATAGLRPRELRAQRHRQGYLLRLHQLGQRHRARRRQDHADVERRHRPRRHHPAGRQHHRGVLVQLRHFPAGPARPRATRSPTSPGTRRTTSRRRPSRTRRGATRPGTPICSTVATHLHRAAQPRDRCHIWCDNPDAETEDQIAAGIRDPLRSLAQQTWGAPSWSPPTPPSSRSWTRSAATRLPEPRSTGNLAQGQPTTASSTETPNFPAADATDGDLCTRWSSRTPTRVAPGRPRLGAAGEPRGAGLGGRLRQGLPDPAVQRRHDLDDRLHPHDRHRRNRDADVPVRHRPLRPDARHGPRHSTATRCGSSRPSTTPTARSAAPTRSPPAARPWTTPAAPPRPAPSSSPGACTAAPTSSGPSPSRPTAPTSSPTARPGCAWTSPAAPRRPGRR